jgi:hypothetical protein
LSTSFRTADNAVHSAGYEEVLFNDSEAHAGPGNHPDSESKDFKHVNGHISWPAGAAVEYQINGSPSSAATKAVKDAVATLDGFITTRTFQHRNNTSQINPCTGSPNFIA